MSTVEIMVQPAPGVDRFEASVVVNLVRYAFAFYRDAAGAWYFDLELSDDAVRGVGLCAGVDLLYPYRHIDGVPPGHLWVIDKALGGANPRDDDWAEGRAALYYLEVES